MRRAMEWTKYRPLTDEIAFTNGEVAVISLENGSFNEDHGVWMSFNKLLDSITATVNVSSKTIPLYRRCSMMTVSPAWINRVYDIEGLSLEDRVFIPQNLKAIRLSYYFRALKTEGLNFNLIINIVPSKGKKVITARTHEPVIFLKSLNGGHIGCISFTEKPSQIEFFNDKEGDSLREGVRVTFNLNAILQRISQLDLVIIGEQATIEDCMKNIQQALAVQYYDNEKALKEHLEGSMYLRSLRRELDQAFIWSKVQLLSSTNNSFGLRTSLRDEIFNLEKALWCIDGLCCLGAFNIVERILMTTSRQLIENHPEKDHIIPLFLIGLSTYYKWKGDVDLLLILHEEITRMVDMCNKKLETLHPIDRKLTLNALSALGGILPDLKINAIERASTFKGVFDLLYNFTDEELKALSAEVNVPSLMASFMSMRFFNNESHSEGLAVIESMASEIASKSPVHPLTPRIDCLSSSLYISSVARGLLGLNVNAEKMHIQLMPYLPMGVNELEVGNIPISSNKLSLRLDIKGNEVNLRVNNQGSKKVNSLLGFTIKETIEEISALTDHGVIDVEIQRSKEYTKVMVRDVLEGKSTRTYTFNLKR
ncbi:MAG: hypothetical protein ACXQTB_01605 [Candidatus Nezhaarchaeales archaeon]